MQTKTGVIYLQKNKFQLYSPYLSNILEFNFVTELVRDFDIANRELFDNLLKAFVINNKIPAGNFIVVIADNASFIKDFTSTVPLQHPQPVNQPASVSALPTLEDLQKQANEFIEHIPFENVAGKTYPLPNGVRAYATNQEMFEAIKTILEKQGFIINIIIPSFAFGSEVNSVAAININTINIIFQKINVVKEYNLLTNPKSAMENFMTNSNSNKEEEPVDDIKPEKEKKANKPIVLIGVISLILIIVAITIGVLYSQFTTVPYKAPAAPVVQESAAVPTSPPVAQENVASSSASQAKDLTVQIIGSSSSIETENSIKSALTPFGFKDISIQPQNNLDSTQGLIFFSSRVTAETKNSVAAEVRKVLGDVIIQNKADASVDISITLGK